jgi:hypothetical protein
MDWQPLVPLGSAVVGGLVVHLLSGRRDRANKRKEHRDRSYIGTRGIKSLSVGGTLKKVVSLKPRDSAFCLASIILSPLATIFSSSLP